MGYITQSTHLFERHCKFSDDIKRVFFFFHVVYHDVSIGYRPHLLRPVLSTLVLQKYECDLLINLMRRIDSKSFMYNTGLNCKYFRL